MYRYRGSAPSGGASPENQVLTAATFGAWTIPNAPASASSSNACAIAIEALVALSKGDSGVRSVGVGDYINLFFDVIDDDFIASGWPGRIQPAAAVRSPVVGRVWRIGRRY
ncbi:hypothetical protein AB0875_27925 [Micromonospora gifhornensis]|uniref:hypothetical protein n=1 Tax=Micromonospora gifhornensis TaxID=84594 RepID=UPI0034549B02